MFEAEEGDGAGVTLTSELNQAMVLLFARGRCVTTSFFQQLESCFILESSKLKTSLLRV